MLPLNEILIDPLMTETEKIVRASVCDTLELIVTRDLDLEDQLLS